MHNNIQCCSKSAAQRQRIRNTSDDAEHQQRRLKTMIAYIVAFTEGRNISLRNSNGTLISSGKKERSRAAMIGTTFSLRNHRS